MLTHLPAHHRLKFQDSSRWTGLNQIPKGFPERQETGSAGAVIGIETQARIFRLQDINHFSQVYLVGTVQMRPAHDGLDGFCKHIPYLREDVQYAGMCTAQNHYQALAGFPDEGEIIEIWIRDVLSRLVHHVLRAAPFPMLPPIDASGRPQVRHYLHRFLAQLEIGQL